MPDFDVRVVRVRRVEEVQIVRVSGTDAADAMEIADEMDLPEKAWKVQANTVENIETADAAPIAPQPAMLTLPSGDDTHPETTVAFQSKAPHKTLGLSVGFPEASPPKALEAALAEIGWRRHSFPPVRPFGGRAELDFERPGTAIFGEWTEAERKKFTAECRAVLRRFGFVNVPHNKLTLADLL